MLTSPQVHFSPLHHPSSIYRSLFHCHCPHIWIWRMGDINGHLNHDDDYRDHWSPGTLILNNLLNYSHNPFHDDGHHHQESNVNIVFNNLIIIIDDQESNTLCNYSPDLHHFANPGLELTQHQRLRWKYFFLFLFLGKWRSMNLGDKNKHGLSTSVKYIDQ